MELNDLYQEIIFEHSKHPKNKGCLEHADVEISGRNPFCGDEIKLTLNVKDGKISDVKFDGQGCAISQASASVMTESIKGKTVQEAEKTIETFGAMVRGENNSTDELDELSAFQGVSAFPTRVKCAMLAWNALKEGIEKKSTRTPGKTK